MTVNNNDAAGASQLNLDQTSLNRSQASSRASGTGTNYATSDSTPGDDTISLSNASSLVQQALNSSSSSRSSRIQELKSLIQNNQYNPDAQEVSSALVNATLAGL